MGRTTSVIGGLIVIVIVMDASVRSHLAVLSLCSWPMDQRIHQENCKNTSEELCLKYQLFPLLVYVRRANICNFTIYMVLTFPIWLPREEEETLAFWLTREKAYYIRSTCDVCHCVALNMVYLLCFDPEIWPCWVSRETLIFHEWPSWFPPFSCQIAKGNFGTTKNKGIIANLIWISSLDV